MDEPILPRYRFTKNDLSHDDNDKCNVLKAVREELGLHDNCCVLLFYVQGKQLWSCQGGQLS